MNIKKLFGSIAFLSSLLPQIYAKEINVTTQTFNEAYTLAESGDILLMSSGTYNKQISFPSDKSITLKAEKNAEVVITFDITGNDDTSENGGGLIFDGVKINRSADYFISGNFGNISTLEFKNSEITNIGRCLLRTSNEGTINNIEFENCLIHDCGNNGWNFLYPKHIVKKVSVKNCSLYNYLGESFFSPTGSDNNNIFTFIFENNTVYKWSKDTKYAICNTAKNYSTNSIYNFTNNIINEPGVSGKTPSILNATGGTLTAEKNLIVNYGGYNRTETINDITLESLGLTTIGFPDAANGDFTILSNSPLATAGKDGKCVGDARWIKQVTSPAQFSATVMPENAGSVSPTNVTFNQGDPVTVTATENFGYSFKQWETKNGEILSTENPYSFNIENDLEIVAVFDKLTTYTFTVNKDGAGAQWGIVNLNPEPTDGKYIEGTIVTMTIETNPITSFLQWEDGSSENKRTVKIDGDKTYTATFDKIPFIVGWDLETSEPRGERPADYAATTDNKGLLSLYNGDGSTTNWGGSTRTFGGITYNCARRYTDYASMNNPRYFQAKFSAKDYVNIKVTSLVAVDNACVHKTQKMQYSLNGNDFTDLTTITMEETSANWEKMEAFLPEEAEGANMVYIRWAADATSDLIGTPGSSDTEGFYLTNIFVYADNSSIDDKEAPILLSTSPENDSNTASANGKIVLSFNEQVQAGTGEIEFNGSAIEPIFGSSTASFEYKGLEYNTSYTFTVPAGAITDRAGNPFEGVTLNFTTMNRPQPIARVFDAVVAADKTGDYESVQAAIDAAPENRTTPYLIFIKNGSYEEQVVIPSDKPNIHLIGQDKEKTNIHLKINVQSEPQEGSQWYQNDTAAWKYSVHNPESPTYQMEGTVVRINSNDFFSENISFINDWGVERQNGPQSLAMMTKGDRITFHNCKFRSYQDTWMTPGNTGYRHYVKGCYIEGAVDYVYGAGDCLFEDCTLYNVRSGSVITAPEHEKGTQWGYVFDHCTIDGNEASNDGKNKLGRPWHNNPICVWLNTTMKVGIAPEGWSEMGGIPALFAEYNSMDIDGNPVDLNNRRTFYTGTDEGMEEGGECKAELSADEAARYTYENIVSGNDNWNPRSLIETIGIPQNVTISENVLSWEAVPYAICYVILRNNEVIGFTTETSYTDAASKDNDEYCIQAVNEAGSLGEKSENVNKGTSAVDKSEKSSFNVTVSNGKIHLSGLSSGEKITVFSLNGAIIYDTVTIENSCFINLSVRGVYLIKAGNEIKKVIL